MKNKNLLFVLCVAFCLGQSPLASSHDPCVFQESLLNTLSENLILQDLEPANLINWKVGDTQAHDMSMGFFGKIGTSNKTVTKDDGAALWFRQEMKIFNKTETVDALINKADGKIIKIIRNGQEQEIPDEKIEIISQEYTEITVPAGTFPVLHVVAKTKQVSKLEIWANPQQIVMDGVAKQIMATQFGDMTFVLTSFKQGE